MKDLCMTTATCPSNKSPSPDCKNSNWVHPHGGGGSRFVNVKAPSKTKKY